ncbi:CoA-transferase [Neobacillus sp.]|jgi:acetate CoA/acetoacetate CoA-transferase alpha subunit|uniref:CoA-transferase n=1 Tax=Neobacillus sp. TaxID=2675273 RepID=UPI002898994C|nr:CoA-transferase [Neobacillus sp.]
MISMEKVSSIFTDGMTIMAGGFMGVGTPQALVSAMLKGRFTNRLFILLSKSFSKIIE